MSSYQVIARKWRPGVFEEVVGQVHVTRTLKNAISSGKIAHAYLFSGPRGVGKTTAARILAKCLNCSDGPTITPCNSCESCKGISAGSSVDVFEIDGASNNGVENVREISESVRYVPSQGKYKVYIIDEVHMLSTAAFNALLKTLEEPPAHAIFIFATTEVHKIPATILSRCQRFDFKRIPFREIQAHLTKIATREGVKFEDKALYTLAREADGSLRDSQSLLEQALAFSGGELKDSDVSEALGLMDRSTLHELARSIIEKDARACLNLIEKICDFGYDLKRGCGDLLEYIRDLTVLKVTGEPALLDLPDSEIERLKENSGRVGAERLHMLFNLLSRGYEEVSRSAHPRYSLEMTLLKAAHFDELEPVSALMARLDGLAAGMPRAEAHKQPSGQANAPRVPWQREAPQAGAPVPVLKKESGAAQGKETLSAKPAAAEKPEADGAEDGGLLGFIQKRNAELFELLKTASIETADESVTIKAADARLEAKIQVNKGALEACCTDFFKKRVSVTVGAASAQKKEEDPVLKDTLRILGGRIIEDRRRTNV